MIHNVSRGMLILTAVFCMLGAKAVWAEDGKKIKVFVLAGQSNMAGLAKATELLPPYDKPISGIKAWHYGTKTWETFSPKVFDLGNKGSFGPDISFGHAMASEFPGEDIRLIKGAMSGTNLYKQWAPSEGGTYKWFMTVVKPAIADLNKKGLEYEIAGMLWLQGESDAAEGKGESYETNLTAFIAHMRGEFKTPKMPFIIARVRDYFGGASGQAEIVRKAQINVAQNTENVAWFDTDDCSMMEHPKGHYDAAGLIEIGKRFARTYKEIVSRSALQKQ